MTRLLPIAALLSFTACSAGDITVRGTVLAARNPDAEGAAGASVELLDDRAELHDSAVSQGEGDFEVEAPRGRTMYMGIEGDDGVVASFSGIAGQNDFTVPARLEDACEEEIVLEDGSKVPSLYVVSADDVAELKALYAGCPTVDQPGGVIVGRVRYFLFERDEAAEDIATAQDTGNSDPVVGCFSEQTSSVPVRNAVVTAEPVDGGDVLQACYLDPEGTGFDSTARNAGASQHFAIFGAPAGRYTAVVKYDLSDDVFTAAFYNVWVPDNGVVPRYPLWVEFPVFQ